MKKFILPIITSLFFTSCVTVFYPAPQPEFAEELTEIPEKFQGKNGLFKYLEGNQEATEHFYNKFKEVLS